MKKYIIQATKKVLIPFSITVLFIGLTSQTIKPKPTQQKQRRLTITLNEQTWAVIMNVIDKADVSHLTIRQIQDSMYSQFNDTTINKK